MDRTPRPALLLLLLAEVVSFALYWPVIAIDAGWLESTDTRLYLELIRADPRPVRFLDLHFIHFLPAQRLIHWVMWGLFGSWWAPWGVVLVVLHGMLAAAAGLLVWTFGRSVAVAVATVIVVAVSWSISTGVLVTFGTAPLLLLMSLVLISPVLVHRWMRARPVRLAVAAYLISLWCILSYIPGAISYVMLALTYAGLWAIRRPHRIDRADMLFLGALLASVVTYLALYLPVLAASGWTLPTDLVLCVDVSGRSQADRFAEYAAFWFLQVLLPADGSTSAMNLGATSLMGLAALGSFQLAFARQTAAEESRSALVIAAVCLAMTLLDALMLTAGRQCIALWHMRYNLYVSVFPAVAVGILAGLSLTTLPRKVAPLLAALLLVGAALVAQRNVNVVLASTWMVDRAPGFVKSMQSPE